ncbi:MAG TPA: BTAD domain-containing putative transcriptional regulator [Acidimicrobiales bacterium]
MTRSFRLVAPEPRSGLVTRPRLLRQLVRRWQRRVTVITGGPGLGKTTLLAQALRENRLAPRGDDVWVGLEPRDREAERLSRVVADALAAQDARSASGGTGGPAGPSGPGGAPPRGDDGVLDAVAVADQLWRRAPTQACLVLDDVHLLPPDSSGARWLATLIDALPTNGHVVLASRKDPPIPLVRYGAIGALLRLTEDELRFSEEELLGFATQRGLEPERLAGTGGWPAMAELAASVEQHVTGNYLWEEVLEPLGHDRRFVLSVLCDLGRADGALASAAVGRPVDLAADLAGIPLVSRDADGWYEPHSLWRTAPHIALPEGEAGQIRRRAARHLIERGRFDAAFDLVESAGLWDEAPALLRAACLSSELPSGQLGRWLAACPEEVRASPAGRLASGLHTASTSPEKAYEPLKQAAKRFRKDGDSAAELTAIAMMGRMAWWWQDVELLAKLSPRVIALHGEGHPVASALLSLGFALACDLAGDDDGVLGQLVNIPQGVLDPATEVLKGWFEGAVHLYSGRYVPAKEAAEHIQALAPPEMGYIADTLELMCLWVEGRVDEVIARIDGVVAAARASNISYTLSLGLHTASIGYSHVGEIAKARELLDEAIAASPAPVKGARTVHTAMATASLLLAEGDEPAAAAVLSEAIEDHGLDRGVDRRWWRQMVSLSYVLVPDARPHWDSVPLRDHLAVCRDLAAAVVAVRNGEADAHLRTLHLPPLPGVRAALHHRHAAELAVGLQAAGRQEGARLLDLLGPHGRAAVRDLTDPPAPAATGSSGAAPTATGDRGAVTNGNGDGTDGNGTGTPAGAAASTTATGPTDPDRDGGTVRRAKLAKQAKALLAAVPAPPRDVTWLGVLGPIELRRPDRRSEPIDDPDLRRQRVQELLAYLVGHRRTTRAAIMAALWPDLDERSAGNNLGVTLNRLLRLLEPWRRSGEPAFYVQIDGPSLQLVTGEHLRIDVDSFDEHVALAARAEADGMPSLALEHNLAAVELYRERLFLDLPEAEWFALDREHYRTRFVRAAVRAGQLLLGHGDVERSHIVAQKALHADQWSEEAYAVLVGGALARGDRSAARRLLDRCMETLADLGAQPSAATEQLRRLVQQPG